MEQETEALTEIVENAEGTSVTVNLFTQDFSVTIAVLLLVILAAIYLRHKPEAPKGLNLMIAGFFSIVLASTMTFIDSFVSVKVVHFLELAFACFASVFFMTAGLALRNVKNINVLLAMFLCIASLSIPVYAVFFNGAPYLRHLIHFSGLGTGFIFLFFGFVGRSESKENYGFSLAALSFFALAAFNFSLITAWGRTYFDTASLYLLLHFFTAVCLLLSSCNLLNDKIAADQEEIQEGQKRLRVIIQASPFPIVISRLRDDRILLANSKAEEMFGIDTKQLSSYRLSDFFADPNFRSEVMKKLEKSNRIDAMDIMVSSVCHSDETWLQLSTHVIDFEFEIALYSAFQDITERKKKELELFHEATRDPLTGAYTRRFFQEMAAKEIQRSIRYNCPFCMAMIDADHFKRVNDTYGHGTGDKVLKELVATCQKVLRKSDVICRYGGEEFLILLMEIELQTAQVVCDRLRAIISTVVVKADNGEEVKFTVSMGLVPSTYSTDYAELVKAVDEALYIAKNSGRNRVVAFAPKAENAEGTDPKTLRAEGQVFTEERVAPVPQKPKEEVFVPQPLLDAGFSMDNAKGLEVEEGK